MYYNNDKKMGGDTSTVKYVISKDNPDIMLSEDLDTLDVLVNTNVMHTQKVIIRKNVSIEKSADQEPSNTLIIIDGVEHREKDAMLAVEPDNIERVDVIKDKKMMKKYTDKDYEGVIIITTKAKKK